MGKAKEKEFLEESKKAWQKKYVKPLGEEDVRGLTENITDFLRILKQWEEG